MIALTRTSVLAAGIILAYATSGGGESISALMGRNAYYSVDSWSRAYGNHRALVVATQQGGVVGDAVRAHISWRRRDSEPDQIGLIVLDVRNRKVVANVLPIELTREAGDIVFQPIAGAAPYEIYYMPYQHVGPPHQFDTKYRTPDVTGVDPAWRERNNLTPEKIKDGQWKSLPEATVVGIQARSEFDRMDPMEVIATQAEVGELVSKWPDAPYLVFPEDRSRPIKMTDDLPQRWIEKGPSLAFQGTPDVGEFYLFQIGLFAARQALENVQVEFKPGEGSVPIKDFCCFNTEGTDWLGRPMKKNVCVPQGKVAALWCGFQIPDDISGGTVTATCVIRPDNAPPSEVKTTFEIAPHLARNHGDDDLWRLSRLRWLNSTIGLDDEVVAPYTPLVIDEKKVACLGRTVVFAHSALPETIEAASNTLLARPVTFTAETDAGTFPFEGTVLKTTKKSPGKAVMNGEGAAGPFAVSSQAKMEFDGYINFEIKLKAAAAVDVKDFRLEIPVRRAMAKYLMGMGRKGGLRPAEWHWKWDIDRANNAVWLGDVGGGLQCKLKGIDDTWNLYNFKDGSLPQPWENGGKGGCDILENGADEVVVRAYTGPRAVGAGEELTFHFGLLVTPVKPLDPRHWSWRYQHQYVPVKDIGTSGANIINIHHGNELNPYINYPFLTSSLLGRYVHEAHKKDVKVKLYYTVRELSNHAAELWPLRSLGTEVFADGAGGGYSWLHEHLVNHYAAAWHQTDLPNDDIDGAIATTGLSRWDNYYLEGLAWLLKNVEIDGLYLDGIGYDRTIMQRLRKVMERARPGSLIDFHSGNNFEPAYGLSNCANQYMEHFPYIDSLWFGEGFDYNESPDYWLVEISGIPFGLFGEMLQGGGNPWRGMLYGMTNRLGWGGDPKFIWALWDSFGIQDARMIGYWDAECPVRTDNSAVLATAYVKKDKTLIALASWAKEPVTCNLQINGSLLGLDAAKVKMAAPGIEGFQPAREFNPNEAIHVEPGKGWLLIIE